MTTIEGASVPAPPEPSTTLASSLGHKLDMRRATVAVMGLGYAGLPLAHAVAEAGFRVLGFDPDMSRVAALRSGGTYLPHLETERERSNRPPLAVTSDPDLLSSADVILICVPTPLHHDGQPNLEFVTQSAQLLSRRLHPGQLVVLVSTTFPGTTRTVLLPILQESGLQCGRDFYLAYSPEREDPGRQCVTTFDIPRVVGGVDPASTAIAVQFFRWIVCDVHVVPTAEVAESSKLLENAYRAVNIALVNELKIAFTAMEINIWDVIAASSTKPFGFAAFYPGPGCGGHCIPIDPLYLAWKARGLGTPTKLLELATAVNGAMPNHVFRRTEEALATEGKRLPNSRVLLIGVSYKPGVADIRETPATPLVQLLSAAGAVVRYHDPLVPFFPPLQQLGCEPSSCILSAETIRPHDCTIILTDHPGIDWEAVAEHSQLIVDTRNAMARVKTARARVVLA